MVAESQKWSWDGITRWRWERTFVLVGNQSCYTISMGLGEMHSVEQIEIHLKKETEGKYIENSGGIGSKVCACHERQTVTLSRLSEWRETLCSQIHEKNTTPFGWFPVCRFGIKRSIIISALKDSYKDRVKFVKHLAQSLTLCLVNSRF